MDKTREQKILAKISKAKELWKSYMRLNEEAKKEGLTFMNIDFDKTYSHFQSDLDQLKLDLKRIND